MGDVVTTPDADVGSVRVAGGRFGEFVLALDRDSYREALQQLHWLPVFAPVELAALEQLAAQGPAAEAAIAAVMTVKRLCAGAVLTAPDASRPAPRCVEELRAAIDAGTTP